jgi:hypothetical protein
MKLHGQIDIDSIFRILLPGIHAIAEKLERDLYQELKEIEGDPWLPNSNEMNLFAFAVMLSSWSAWCFKSKSEDPNRQEQSRSQAAAVSKHLESIITKAIQAGERIGQKGGRPDKRTELLLLKNKERIT